MAEMMDRTIGSIMTALIAVVLIGAAFIPTALNIIDDLSEIEGAGAYTALLSVVITMTIVGVIIGVIKSYTSKSREAEFDE